MSESTLDKLTCSVMRLTITAAFLAALSSQALAQIPAFPGADGAASLVSGGRGGIVYHVTKLESAIDDSARFDFGTLRYGLNNNNFPAGVPRTIVFDVGGVFNLGRLPQPDVGWDPNGNGWDAQSRLTIGGTNVTLAGQTAPGAGVIFMGGGLKPQGNNNIIRNITIASGYGMRGWWKPGEPMPAEPVPNPTTQGPGIFPDATVYDALDISGTNLMIDHVSTLYATDETISMNENADNITIQFSNISQGQNYPQWDAEGGGFTGHALGSLLEAGDNAAISFHHNLYAHQKARVPQSQGGGGYYDFRNNVFYNWFGTAGRKIGSSRWNLVGNFYLAGDGGDNPNGGNNTGVYQENGGTSVISGSSSLYREGNLLDTNKDGDPDDGTLIAGGAAAPLWSGGVDTYAGTTDSARDTFDRVLDYVGANWWTRDAVIDTPDERIIDEARNGTGKILAWADNPWDNNPAEGAEWRALVNTPQTNRATDWDTEADVGYGIGDGMPTNWELKHGLDPNARDDTGDFDSDGYTNLEEYLNEIAAWPAPNAIQFNNANSDGRFAHILNWDANPEAGSVHPWQPSRYDTAVIDNGTVTVDAVGQHAGNLLLATAPGDNATLNITSGWLQVEDAPHGMSDGATVIGDNAAATATLNLSGGKLITKSLLKGPNGFLNFTGGVLTAEVVGFDFFNQGGTIAPGEEIGTTHVMGDLAMIDGSIELQIAGTNSGEFDLLLVDGLLAAGGTLEIKLLDYAPLLGDTFDLLDFNSLSGSFSLDLPPIDAGLLWDDSDLLTTGELSVIAGTADPDFNGDGSIDGLDFLIWQAGSGATSQSDNSLGDANGDGDVNGNDLSLWQMQYGTSTANSAAVPEPSAGLLLSILALALPPFRSQWSRSDR